MVGSRQSAGTGSYFRGGVDAGVLAPRACSPPRSVRGSRTLAGMERTPGDQHTRPAFLGEPTGAEMDGVGEAAEGRTFRAKFQSGIQSLVLPAYVPQPCALRGAPYVTLPRLGFLICPRGTWYCHLPSWLWPVENVTSMRALVQSWHLRCICFVNERFQAPFCFLFSP